MASVGPAGVSAFTPAARRSLAGMLLLALHVAAVLCVIAAGSPSGLADPVFPALTGRVVDEARLLDPAVAARLEAKLARLEARTTDQFVVVTVKSLMGHDMDSYGLRLGNTWGIGRKDKNNGVLLIVAPNERKVRIEVGYGLEATLTNGISRLILDEFILPAFRRGDFNEGIERGVDKIIRVLTASESRE